MSVLVLESGSARHRMRKKIPDHDIVVTNYSLLRRDLEDLQTYPFNAIVLDEAQFIKNPGAQVTQSVKQLNCKIRLALTGTPLENRLLDLWSITDFVQPGYLGDENISTRHMTRVVETVMRQWLIDVLPVSAFPPAYDQSCCAVLRNKWPKICQTELNSVMTAN